MSKNVYCSAAPYVTDNHTFLDRPPIHRLLHEAIQKPVTTIVAGTGYGKTQAVYAFLSQYEAITIWLQLSSFDNVVTRFWENFTYAISLLNKPLAAKLRQMGIPETIQAFEQFLETVHVEINQDKKYVLVFDDFYVIHAETLLDFIQRMIDAHLPNMSFIIISRNEPQINTIGLLSKGMLFSMNEGDLRFSQQDMIDFFHIQGLRLPPVTMAKIYQHTEGWIFAIHLVGLSQKNGISDGDCALSAAKENITRLLENELFTLLSKDAQEFLVKLSFFDNLPLGLIQELSSENPSLAREVLKVSSFIRYDAFINTYRIHHLLLEFLCKKQATLKPSAKKKTFIKAADWYARNDYRIEAITFYELVSNYDQVLKIILLYPFLVPTETSSFLMEVLQRAAKAMTSNQSIPELLYTRFLLERCQINEAQDQLFALKARYQAMASSRQRSMALCGIAFNLGTSALYNSDLSFACYFKMAYETGMQIIKRDYELVICNYACRLSSIRREDFGRFIRSLTEGMSYAIYVANGFGEGYDDLVKAEYAFFQKDLKQAEKHAIQSLRRAQQNHQFSIEYMATFYLIRMQLAWGDYGQAIRLLSKLEALTKENSTSYCHTIYDIIAGWYYASTGQSHKVALWIRDYSDYRSDGFNRYGLHRLVRARCCLAEGKYHEVLGVLSGFEGSFGFKDLALAKIETHVLTAVALYHSNEQAQAINTLEATYALAKDNGFDMPFIELGNTIRSLLKAAMQHKSCSIPKPWLASMYTKTSTYAKSLSHVISEYKMSSCSEEELRLSFTKKELELLKDLCYGLSREEMAVNSSLSINSVNSMIQTIYGKLGATNALDAVRIAASKQLVK